MGGTPAIPEPQTEWPWEPWCYPLPLPGDKSLVLVCVFSCAGPAESQPNEDYTFAAGEEEEEEDEEEVRSGSCFRWHLPLCGLV